MGVQGLVIKKLAAASRLWSYRGACPIDHSSLLPYLCTFALCGTIYTIHPHQIIRWFTPCLHKTNAQRVIPLMCKWVLYNSVDTEVNCTAINSQVYSVCVHKCGLRGWQNINYTDVDCCTKQTFKIERNLGKKYSKYYFAAWWPRLKPTLKQIIPRFKNI